MTRPTIGFVGGGNMATAIIRGLIDRGQPPRRIVVADPSQERRDALSRVAKALRLFASNAEAAAAADVLVLAVKPQVMRDALGELRTVVQAHRPLVISVAAGVTAAGIDRMLGGGLAIVRCMPNQPALLGEGMTVATANRAARERQTLADDILSATGPTLWVEDEAMIDAATAISGSGPAYFYYLMEALFAAAREFGFSAEHARLLVNQTARGAAAVAAAEADDLAALRERVTSPGGTTAAALGLLEDANIRDIFMRAFRAARQRATELAGGSGEPDAPASRE